MYFVIYRDLNDEEPQRVAYDGVVEILNTEGYSIKEYTLPEASRLASSGETIHNMLGTKIWYMSVMHYITPDFKFLDDRCFFRGIELFTWKTGIYTFTIKHCGEDVVRLHINEEFAVPKPALSVQYVEKINRYYRLCVRVRMQIDTISTHSPRALFLFIIDENGFVGVEKSIAEGGALDEALVEERFFIDNALKAKLSLFKG